MERIFGLIIILVFPAFIMLLIYAVLYSPPHYENICTASVSRTETILQYNPALKITVPTPQVVQDCVSYKRECVHGALYKGSTKCQ